VTLGVAVAVGVAVGVTVGVIVGVTVGVPDGVGVGFKGDSRYCPLAAALSPSLIASASLTYLPFLVVP
jgi:hypothetical protein